MKFKKTQMMLKKKIQNKQNNHKKNKKNKKKIKKKLELKQEKSFSLIILYYYLQNVKNMNIYNKYKIFVLIKKLNFI